MRPALSVVAFTVLSGAGLGALVVAAVLDLVGLVGGDVVAPLALTRSAALAWVLVVAGLCSSTLHLGKPRNAWRSLSRVRSSWLSREAAVSLALMPIAAGWIALVHIAAEHAWRGALALATIALAWATLYCTAMIYASLKPIRQWHTRRVPVAYFVLGHASGALVVIGVLRAQGESPAALAVAAGVLLLAAAAVKLDYYAFIASAHGRLSIEQAIGVPHGVGPPAGVGTIMRARLLDVGHSRGTFLTHEFVYTLAAAPRMALRLLFWSAGVVVPAAWLAWGLDDWHGAVLAIVACLVGFGAERWLFFAEARHTVRLYHGDRST